MNKGYLFLASLILLGLIYSFANEKNLEGSSSESSAVFDHAVVIYAMNDKDIQVYYGGDRIEEIKAQKEGGVQGSVVDVFNKLGQDGFSLKSTTASFAPGVATVRIVCFFEREK